MSPEGGGATAVALGKAALRGLSTEQQQELLELRHQFVSGLTRDMQDNIDELLDLNEVVVGGLLKPRLCSVRCS